jgi:phage terminase large subunit
MATELDLPEAFEPLFYERADDGGPVRYRAFYGGRGSAKSHSIASALLVKARARPLTILCAREIQRSIKESVKRLLDRKIAAHGFGAAGDGFYQSLETEIRGRNGSLFTFAGLRTNVDSIQSMEGIDIAYVSEARSVSQASLDILTPTVRAPGSEIWFDWNPREEADPVDVMFRGEDGPPPGSIVRRVNHDQNPWFPEELRREMEWDRQRDPDKHAHIWLGGYQKHSEARVFHNWRVEEFETPADAVHRFGADWGFSVDPSVLGRCHLKGRTL